MNDVFKTQLTTDMFNRMLGMNNLVAVLNNISYEDNKYPPHNVYKDGDNYVVEIALAGWEEDDISVIVENLELTIKGEKQDSDRTARHMAYKGISTKNFSKKFVLAPHYVVTDATFKNGLLTIEVNHLLPEELKPREIKIST
jgi:molecular chaperone IbpA